MNLLLFIVILLTSFIVVRIGAIAFELTGLEWSLAKFQALSCFTGTGFTTKESELVTRNPQRRRIASVLIVVGHAGLVSLIATFANSLRTDIIMPKFTIPFLHSVLPSQIVPWINLAIIAAAVYATYKIFTNSKFVAKLTEALRSHIVKKEIIKPVSFEDLVVVTGGYGVSSIEVCKDSPVLNKTLLESELRQHDITILTIERQGQAYPNPSAETRILLGDRLICFGKLGNIRNILCVMPK
jgi:hypothetical protein